jgi:hypothetical protein
MGISASVQVGVAVPASGVLSACTGTTHGPDGSSGDCVSQYDAVAAAPTWTALKEAMLGREERGRVASVRTQLEEPTWERATGMPGPAARDHPSGGQRAPCLEPAAQIPTT